MNEHAALGRDIFVIEKYFRIYLKNEIKGKDINTVEAMVLLVLYEYKGAISEIELDNIHRFKPARTQDQIISELQYDKAAMTRIMQSLENKELVIRTPNPEDNRSYLFSMTEKAVYLIPEILAALEKWNSLLTKDVDNISAVKAATSKMAQNARNIFRG